MSCRENGAQLEECSKESIVKHDIITDNQYFKYAFSVLLSGQKWSETWCVIDFESCKSLTMVYKRINGIDKNSKVILVGGLGVYQSLLSGFTWFSKEDDIGIFLARMSRAKIKPLEELYQHLQFIINLQFLSVRQVNISALTSRYDANHAAKIMNINIKTVNSVLDRIKNKMKFKSMSHLHFFMRNEYGIDDLDKLSFVSSREWKQQTIVSSC